MRLSETCRQRRMCGKHRKHQTDGEKKGEADVNNGGFPATPARQRRALKLEIPATTEWTKREGTCLGKRNCPFSASMHLFTVLSPPSLSPLLYAFNLFFPSFPSTLFFYSCFLSPSVFSRSSFYPFLLLGASMSRLLAELSRRVGGVQQDGDSPPAMGRSARRSAEALLTVS